jgi:plasmid stability protein
LLFLARAVSAGHRGAWIGAEYGYPHATLFLESATAAQRYVSNMATMQIREIPGDVYEVIRKRARAAGRSIQSYMRYWVIDFASRPTTEEALAAMEGAREASDTPGAMWTI